MSHLDLDTHLVLNDALFALAAADRLGWPSLNRTNFQKILFFSAVLSPLNQLDWGYEFTNANYGPFSRKVHTSTDKLVIYKYVEIVDWKVHRDSKFHATYRITDIGKDRANTISKLEQEGKRYEWIYLIMKTLDIYGTQLITKLAYKEPTFSQMRQLNKGGTIDLSGSNNESLVLIEKVANELRQNYSIELDTLVSKIIVYFDFLSAAIGRSSP